jgi:glutamate-1-semialdehyde 2,1-aminomutase
MGVVLPAEGFLPGLRALCDENGALLIFDEVITGFRLGLDGAQGVYGVTPDLTTFGKIIGGGMPVGAYGGRRDVMEMVAPSGPVYQAGTLSGNPVAMAAGMCQLQLLRDMPGLYAQLNAAGDGFFAAMEEILTAAGVPHCLNHICSLGCVFFTGEKVVDYPSAQKSNTARYTEYFRAMLERGVYLAPSQFEAMFLSAAHTAEDLDAALGAVKEFVR